MVIGIVYISGFIYKIISDISIYKYYTSMFTGIVYQNKALKPNMFVLCFFNINNGILRFWNCSCEIVYYFLDVNVNSNCSINFRLM